MKNPLTPPGIEPATFRFVVQHLNRCATAVLRIKLAFRFISWGRCTVKQPSNLCISFTVVHRFLIFICHSCSLTVSSDVQFLSYTTLSNSSSHFTSGRPHSRLPSGDQVIIHLVHLLASLRTTYPIPFQHFILYSVQNCLCHLHFFSNYVISYC